MIFTELEILTHAASLERGSEHPLAAAIISGAKERNIDLVQVDGFEAVTGKGVKAIIAGKLAALGNSAMMATLGLNTESIKLQADEM